MSKRHPESIVCPLCGRVAPRWRSDDGTPMFYGGAGSAYFCPCLNPLILDVKRQEIVTAEGRFPHV